MISTLAALSVLDKSIRSFANCAIGACLLVAVTSVTFASSAQAEDDRIGVVKSMYAAFGAGDIAAVEKLVHPNVVWVVRGQEHIIPIAGTFRGWPGVQRFFAAVGQSLDMQAFEPGTYSLAGNVVSVLGSERARVKETGGIYDARWVHLATVEDGLITRFEEITDTGAQIQAFRPANAKLGKAYFTTCLACHGVNGQGQSGMHAPNLTVLSQEYLIRQLRNFRSETRGGTSDFYGWQMNGRSRALADDRAVRDVVAYIDTLPDVVSYAPTISSKANGRDGKKIYRQSCASCHGDSGEGNSDLNSPALAGLQDWYLVEQLANFRSGIRGSNANDVYGQQMKPFADSLKDEDAVLDVVKYITRLEGK